MGLYKRYNDTPLLTRMDNIEGSISDIVADNDSQAQSIVTLFQSDIDQNAINRVYLRREKSGNTTVPPGGGATDVQFDYQVQGNLKGMIATSDAITFTFKGNGVFLINASVSCTDLVQSPLNETGYTILDMIIPGQKIRRLSANHFKHLGNYTMHGSTVLIVNDGTQFKLQATIVENGTILGHVSQARTFLEIFQL